MDYEFEKNINKIRNSYKKNPIKTNRELKKAISNLENKKMPVVMKEALKEINLDIFIFCIFSIMIALLGISSHNLSIYFLSLLSFLFGLFIGMFIKGFGLIFLFSHGIGGLYFMELAMIDDVLKNPRFTDGPTLLYVFLGIVVLLFVVATIITFIYNLSDTVKKIRWFKFIPIAIYFLGLLLTRIFVYVI